MLTPPVPQDYETPITVLVTEGRWDVIDTTTVRNFELTKILTEMGGVTDGTPLGTYYFNVVAHPESGLHYATLIPA